MVKQYTQDWFDRCISDWTELLSGFKDQPKLKFLEIGCFEGRSTCWLLDNILTHPSSHITCIDLFEGCSSRGEWSKELYDRYDMSQVYENFLYNTKEYGPKVSHRVGPSNSLLRNFDRVPMYDFIYIDGSHIACDVLEDAVLSFPLLCVGGIMVMDDYEWNFFDNQLRHPGIAIDAFLRIYSNQIDIIKVGRQVFVRKTNIREE